MENRKNSSFPFPKPKWKMENSIYIYFLSSISEVYVLTHKRKGLNAAFSSMLEQRTAPISCVFSVTSEKPINSGFFDNYGKMESVPFLNFHYEGRKKPRQERTGGGVG